MMDAQRMADQLALSIGIDEACQTAFAKVPRELFWAGPDPYDPSSGGLLKSADNVVISTASMPFAMAQIMLAAELRDGMRVMELGAGSGYMAAILAERLGQGNVVTIEADAEMVGMAAKNLAAAGFGDVEVVTGDGLDGLPGRQFDAILASFSVTGIPPAWLQQCPGGRIVAPWATRWTSHNTDPKVSAAAVLNVRDGAASGRFYPNLRFMQAHAQRFDRIPALTNPGSSRYSIGPRLRPGAVIGKFHPAAAFYLGLVLSGVGYRMDDGVITVCDDTSWARAVGDEAMMRTEVLQAGPRDLWTELQTAYTGWCAMRHPSIDRFGVSVDTAGRHRYWLDDPSQLVDAL